MSKIRGEARLTRIAIGLKYQGAAYCGWQKQANNNKTIQFEVERALSKVANEPISVVCAGRTDAGVHATCQIIHFDTQAKRSDYSWLMGVNSDLPDDVRVVWVKEVPDEFHARFDALERTYQYYICNRKIHSPFINDTVTWHGVPLDETRMQAAANHLIGTHDFNAYRASSCQAHSPVRTIKSLDVTRDGDFIVITVTANAFLHHMIRNIAGVLMLIGEGKRDVGWSLEILKGKDRTLSAKTARPKGLYLTSIVYDNSYNLPQMAVFGCVMPT